MKTIKLFRASGLPIEIEDSQKIKDTFKAKFDELESKHGKASQENSEIFTSELNKLEDECLSQFPRSREVKLSQVPKLIKEFKCAIAITLALIDNKEQLAMYLMDNG
jgi:organic radical activating enzyme